MTLGPVELLLILVPIVAVVRGAVAFVRRGGRKTLRSRKPAPTRSRSRFRRLGLGTAAMTVVMALFALPGAAFGLSARQKASVDDESSFSGNACGSEDTAVLRTQRAHRRPYRLTARPVLGTVLHDASGEATATISNVALSRLDGRGQAVWTARGSHATCDPSGFYSPDGTWATDSVSLKLSYWYRENVRFSRGELRSDARAAISGKFGSAWRYGYGRRLSCRKTSKFRGRCRFSWLIGDGVYQGSMRSRMFVRRRRYPRQDLVLIRNRGRVRLTDEYCLVTGGSNCYRYYRIKYY